MPAWFPIEEIPGTPIHLFGVLVAIGVIVGSNALRRYADRMQLDPDDVALTHGLFDSRAAAAHPRLYQRTRGVRDIERDPPPSPPRQAAPCLIHSRSRVISWAESAG